MNGNEDDSECVEAAGPFARTPGNGGTARGDERGPAPIAEVKPRGGERRRIALLLLIMVVATLGVAGVVIHFLYRAATEEGSLHLGAIRLALLVALALVLVASVLLLRTANPLLGRLEESERRYRALFDAGSDAIFLMRSEDMLIEECNEQACQLLGYEKEEIVGRTAFDFSPPLQDGDRTSEDVARVHVAAALAGELQRLPWTVVRKDGEAVEADLSGVAIEIGGALKIQVSLRDVTAQKQAERDRVRLATAVDQASECVVITDPEGAIEYANPAFEKTTGYAVEEVIGQNPRVLKSGEQDESFYRELWETITEGRVWRGHFINKRKDGTLYEEEASIAPVRDESGRIAHFVAVKRDVTNEVQLQNQLVQAQKMEIIGQLAGGIAHDFNSILTPIRGYAEMALQDASPESRAYLERVLQGTQRAASLAQHILALSRREGVTRRPLRLQSIIEEGLNLLQATLPSTIQLQRSLEADCPPVMADPSQMVQVLLNLGSNGRHAMRERGGVLEVRLESYWAPGRTRASGTLAPGGPRILLTVRDTGQGMDAATVERIFDPFFTTKEPHEGTGLGLAVVRGIVSRHGGEIHAESQPGAGTTICVSLPAIDEEPDLEVAPDEEDLGGRERILLVDDDEDVVSVASSMLRPLGYEVDGRTRPELALEAFRARPDHYDLVITDQIMPGMSGTVLCRSLLRVRSDLPIVLITGFGDIITGDDCREEGIRELVLKPFSRRELGEAIHRALG